MDQCSPARHPTGHPPLLAHRRGHGLSVGLDVRTRDKECSPAGGSDTRILLQPTGCSPIRDSSLVMTRAALLPGVVVGALSRRYLPAHFRPAAVLAVSSASAVVLLVRSLMG